MNIFVVKEKAQERYNICKECDRYESITTLCKECGCITKLKVKLVTSTCPIGKWIEQN
jgi:hypothetical protein